jgi:hypothetical protein
MKSFPLKLVAILTITVCILTVGVVSALDQDEAAVEAVWENQYYQGENATVKIIFQNKIADELVIYRISLHFDWMPQDDFYSYDLSANPRHVQGDGSQLFELTGIPFLVGASAGEHSYYVSFDLTQNGVNFIWDSPSLTVQIKDGNEKNYNELAPQVNNRINNASFTNPEAQSLLQQAKNEYDNASSLANEGEWQEAVSSLQAASDYLDQAEVAEQSGPLVGNLLLYFIVVVVAVVIVVLLVAVFVRKSRKEPYSAETEEPSEPMEPEEPTE